MLEFVSLRIALTIAPKLSPLEPTRPTPKSPPVGTEVPLASAVVGLLLLAPSGGFAQDWRTASQEPAGLAPDAASTPEAVVQVYGARAWGWRGNFGVHTWVAVKPAKAEAYVVYEVIGWKLR